MIFKNDISIWFFNGLQLLVNGVLILGAGIYQYFCPPQQKVALFHVHAGIWWGATLAAIGLAYSLCFAPWRTDRNIH